MGDWNKYLSLCDTEYNTGPISPVVIMRMELMNEAEKAHNPLSKKFGRATLIISTNMYGLDLKYFSDKGIFVLPER